MHDQELEDLTTEMKRMTQKFIQLHNQDLENHPVHEDNSMAELRCRLDDCRKSEEEWSRQRRGANKPRQPRRQLTRADSSLYIFLSYQF